MAGNGGACEVGEEMHKIFLTPREGVNVALAENGAEMVKPEMEANALNEDLNSYTQDIIGWLGEDNGRNLEGIVIQLRDNFLLNRIRILLWDQDERSYSYYLEVSMDGKGWTRICDHTKYLCRSWQTIAFPKAVMRFIRIVGTYNSLNCFFHVVTVQAFLARDPVELDLKWNLLGSIVPRQNVATVEHGAKVIHGIGGNNMINGDTTNGDGSFTYHEIGKQPIVLQLSQPYVLSSMRFLLWDGDDRDYRYEVNVSTDLVNWTTIARRQNEKAWQTIKFEPVPVVFVRIMGVTNSANDEFHVIHIELPDQTEASEVQA